MILCLRFPLTLLYYFSITILSLAKFSPFGIQVRTLPVCFLPSEYFLSLPTLNAQSIILLPHTHQQHKIRKVARRSVKDENYWTETSREYPPLFV